MVKWGGAKPKREPITVRHLDSEGNPQTVVMSIEEAEMELRLYILVANAKKDGT